MQSEEQFYEAEYDSISKGQIQKILGTIANL